MNMLLAFIVLTAGTAPWAGGTEVRRLLSWEFDQAGGLEGWLPNAHLTDVQVRDAALSCTGIGSDPFLTSPVFEIPARPWQYIEVRMKSDEGGDAEFFWSNTLQGKYGGFSPGKETRFHVRGDNEWHTYHVFPFWHAERKIVRVRFDLFTPGHFVIDSIRVVDLQPVAAPATALSWDFREARDALGWWALGHAEDLRLERRALCFTATSGDAAVFGPPLRAEIGDRLWVSLRARVSAGRQGAICWATEGSQSLHRTAFRLIPDGRLHSYNVNMSGETDWQGGLLALGVQAPGARGAEVEIEQLSINTQPLGPPELSVSYFGFADGINRTSRPCRLILSVLNSGGEPAIGGRVLLSAPRGLRLLSPREQKLARIDFMLPEQVTWEVMARRPFEGIVKVRLIRPGAPPEEYETRIEILPDLGLPKSDYVPEPRPVRAPQDLLMYYYPGWGAPGRWECIRHLAPVRKPVLGYYDEGNPECADWQIKWAVEHGIKGFLVDWYWCQGGRSHEHWLHDAYMNARYRRYLKFAIMWANHNPKGTHSLEDWRDVTQYWIDHYFGMEEYYRIDDRPAVFIWSPPNVRRDLGSAEKTQELYALSQRMARQAGHKGIYFVAMHGHRTAPEVQERVAEGYQGASTYHWWGDAPEIADSPLYFPFELVVRTSTGAWARHADLLGDGLDWIFTIDSGWDSRPWHGDRARVIHGRTPELFERLLREGKAFADETHRNIIALGPANEWGEGSYLEPCAEWGFAMYDKIRQVFCEPGEWPPNIAPVDVGLGPYDFAVDPYKTAWHFDQEGDAEGWGPLMGLANVKVQGGRLGGDTTSRDPALVSPPIRLNARDWPYLVIGMRITPPPDEGDKCQVFWTTPTAPTTEPASQRAELAADDRMHTYVLHLAANPRWRGPIVSLRFDPCSARERQVEIDEIRLSADGA